LDETEFVLQILLHVLPQGFLPCPRLLERPELGTARDARGKLLVQILQFTLHMTHGLLTCPVLVIPNARRTQNSHKLPLDAAQLLRQGAHQRCRSALIPHQLLDQRAHPLELVASRHSLLLRGLDHLLQHFLVLDSSHALPHLLLHPLLQRADVPVARRQLLMTHLQLPHKHTLLLRSDGYSKTAAAQAGELSLQHRNQLLLRRQPAPGVLLPRHPLAQ
jgi:hypothetical protein